MKKILLAWIGKTDLEEISNLSNIGRGGPIASLLAHHYGRSFSEAHVLSSGYKREQVESYLTILQKISPIKIVHHRSTIRHPMDHFSIYQVVDRLLSDLKKKDPSLRFAYHLSPGTSAMVSVWMLVGHNHTPGEFYRTWINDENILEVSKVEIPFSIDFNILPQAIRESSEKMLTHWQEIPEFNAIIGQSEEMKTVKSRAAKAALFDVPILVLGESGTGKEMLAQAIHKSSHRKNEEFQAINCAAIPVTLAESELFGHKKGAFSGATNDRKGLFSRCDKGTLFLDEVGELAPAIQSKLLRVLQDKTFTPLGSMKEERSDARIIAATNQPLLSMMQHGDFRGDLFQRLAVAVIELPPLRVRQGDFEHICFHLIKKINTDFKTDCPPPFVYKDKQLSADAMEWIKKQEWPGNIRELNNLLRRAALWSEKEILTENDLIINQLHTGIEDQSCPVLPEEGLDLDRYMKTIEESMVKQALGRTKSKARAAELLGLNYKTFISRLRSRHPEAT